MKKIFLSFLFSQLLCLSIFGQNQKQNKVQITDNQWITAIDYQNDHEAFFEKNKANFGLNAHSKMDFQKVVATKNGWQHSKFQQTYKDLKVLNAIFTLHEKKGRIKKGNGNIFPNININTTPSLSKKEVASIAKNHSIHNVLSENQDEWPDGFDENLVDTETPILVIADKHYPSTSGTYTLAFQFEVSHHSLPPRHDEYLVDAHSGEVIAAIPHVCEINVDGIAKTKYYGEQKISVDSVGPNEFLLRDSSRGDGIFTRDNRNAGMIFSDDDNYWNNVNEWQDEVAGDAHYASIAFYDYMKDSFNYNSIDNEGKELLTNVHVINDRSYVNAYWTGSTSNYGDGDCLDYGPLTTLDVVAHEYAHGFTQFSSDLIYQNESGGLNESMSDIFGKAVEHYFDPQNFTWEVGRKFIKNPDANPFRDMSNPNEYSDPKYYKGEHWSRTNAVHTNSGVMNYWFQMLVEGEADTTETGHIYDVPALGWEKMMNVMFTMQVAYLMPDSDYFHAMESSFEAAKDLFGEGSFEHTAIEDAWRAVGLWKAEPFTLDRDFSIRIIELDTFFCGEDEAEFDLSVEVTNLSNQDLMVGERIELGHYISIFRGFDQTDPTLEIFTLDSLFAKGTSQVFTFTEKGNFEGAGTFEDRVVAFIAEISEDQFPFNDFDSQIVEVSESATTDISLSLSAGFLRCDSEEIRINATVSNRGCQILPEGTEVEIRFKLNGREYIRDYTVSRDLESGRGVGQSFNFPISDFDGWSFVEYSGEVFFSDDTNPENNDTNGRTIRLFQNATVGYAEDFSDFDLQADPILALDNSNGCLYDLVEYNGNAMIGFSGDDRVPSGLAEGCDQIFKVVNDNRRFLSEIEFCVDVTGVSDPLLAFDMTQFRHELDRLVAPEHTALLRLSISDPDFEDQYIFGQTEGEIIKQFVELPRNFNDKVLLEAFTFSGSEGLITSNEFQFSDYVLIDNIELTTRTVSTDDQANINQFKVFPNPTADLIWFVDESKLSNGFDVEIFDALGSKIGGLTQQINKAAYNTSNLQNGIYFYKIRNNNALIGGGKFVVKKN